MANTLTWPYKAITEELRFDSGNGSPANFSSLDFLEATQVLLDKVENPSFSLLKWATLLLEFCQPTRLHLIVRLFEQNGSKEICEKTRIFFSLNSIQYRGVLVPGPDNCFEIELYHEAVLSPSKLTQEFSLASGEPNFLRLEWSEARFDQEEVRRNIALAAAFVRNFLERQQLNQKLNTLQQTEALRLALLDQAEHDLHGPFGSLALATGILLDKGLDLPANELRLILQRLKRNAFNLNILLEHYLHAPRLISEGQIPPPNLQVISLLPRLQTLAELTALQLEGKEQKLEVVLPDSPGLLKVWADEHFLDQILLNLIYNAHRHTPAGSQLRLEVKPDGNFLKISVIDNGPGIAPELLPKFEALFQGKPLLHNRIGLGLKLIYELAKRQEGLAGFSSDPGTTTFWVKLPLAD